MRHLLIGIIGIFALPLFGQFHEPVKWETSIEPIAENEYQLLFKATIDEGWSIYSQYLEGDGPIPTSFSYEEGAHFERIGLNEESGNKKEGYDKVFDMEVIKFMDQAIFSQKVNVIDPSKPIEGFLEFMACDAEQCLPPQEVPFSFTIPVQQENTSTSIPEQEEFLDPVLWSLSTKQVSEDTLIAIFTATMDEGWTIYSQFMDEDGPVPTEFGFDKGSHFVEIGQVKELNKPKKGPDPIFGGITVAKFLESPVLFEQKLLINAIEEPITGYVLYMTCDDKQCLPPTEVPFQINPQTGQAWIGEDHMPGLVDKQSANNLAGAFEDIYGVSEPVVEAPIGHCSDDPAINQASISKIFFLGFLGGLLALLTPCVFPMIPLTVSFFTKGSENRSKGIRNALLYGFAIFGIYLLFSIPFHVMDSVNSDIFNEIATKVWLNILFFIVFLVFAISFFGYFEITLPSSWVNQSSAAESFGGFVGIFFMALTLALVSFSCTGPILGSLLVGALSSSGGAWQLTAGMGGFGLALALPFGLFAAFPGWMNALPKSGGWLNTVKVVLGFIELGLAFKFLSNADLVKGWGLLKIEPFLVIWMMIALGLAAYLFGWIKFPHDSPIKKPAYTRYGLGLLSFAFAVYLAFGFRYNDKIGSYQPLGLLSGLAPPVCYSIWHSCDCPQGLPCFKDYKEGLAYAKKLNKPIMIDFTGYACVNCRKMEEHIWPEAPVYNQIKDDYVLISLYVDDKKELPEAEQIVLEKARGGSRKLKNYGNKWAHFQEFFGANSQPYYVLLSPEEQLLAQPVGYTPDVEEFASFLDCGTNAFRRVSEK